MVGAHPIGNMRIAQDFDRVLELVADRRHESAIQPARVDLDPEDTKGAGDLDGQQQAGRHAVPTLAVVHVDEAVGILDG